MASRVGFVILSHRGTDWPLLARLFPRLRELPEASIALHHDTYQSPLNRELIERYDVQVVPAVGRTSWSNIINVFATVAELEVLFRQPRRPRWYVTLSQSCYPIKSASHIAKILDGLTDDFYIDMRLVNFQASHLLLDKYVEDAIRKYTLCHIPFISRYGRFYWRPLKIYRPRSVIPFRDGFYVFHGSNWLVLSECAVEYLLRQDIACHPVTEFYLTQYDQQDDRQSPCPQEIVIQSILGNARELKGAYRNWHYIDWEGAKDWHPNVLTERHWSAIIASDALWARKFDLEKSATLLKRIDTEILDT